MSAPRPGLFERERALAAITAAVQSATEGAGSALFLVAEPGLGKTTMLSEAASIAGALRVSRAGCSETEAGLPFDLLTRLLGPLGAPSPRLRQPEVSSLDARADRYLALLEWLRVGAPRPIVLLVDDLHWADPDSARLLDAACRRLGDLAVALVATARPWPSAAVEQALGLAKDGFAAVERLEPLSRDASRCLLTELAGADIAPATAEQALEICAGNPLLLGETAAALRRSGNQIAAPFALAAKGLFLARFAGVDAAALQLARGASILGSRFSPLAAAAVVGYDGQNAISSLDALCRAGVVREAGRDAEFVHPLFRQALYEDMAEPVRQALHAQAWRVLLARGATPAEAALHAVAARLHGDQQAVGALAAAGRSALAAGAVATAAGHLGDAARLAGSEAPGDLLTDLAAAELALGQVEQAGSSLGHVLADPSITDRQRVGALRLLGQVLLASAGSAEAQRRAEEASEIALRFDPVLACDILLDSTFIGWLFAGTRRTRAVTGRVLQMIEHHRITDERLRMAAFTADANLAYLQADPYGIEEMSRRALTEIAHGGSDRPASPWSWDLTFGYVHLAKLLERFDDDEAGYSALAGRARESGAMLTFQTYAVNHADTLWRLGRLGDALALLESGAALAELVPTLAPFVSVGLAHIYHERGQDDRSALWAGRVESLMGAIGESPYLRLWLLMLSCRNSLRAGKLAAAAAAAEAAGELADRSGILEPCVVPWHGAAIEALVMTGELGRAEELCTRLEELCAPLPCRAPRATTAAGRALVAWRQGRLAEAEACYEQAVDLCIATPMPLAQADALVQQGRFLRHCGRLREAKQALRRALEVLEPTGAGRLQRIATDELAAAGGRRRRRHAPDELTPRERNVAELAAAGLTNKQIAQRLFVSAKTVDHHLSSVYAKLQLASRRELMVAWRDGRPEQPPT